MGMWSDAWGLFKKAEGLLALESAHGQAIKAINAALADLSQRVQRLENREDIVVNEAKAAARAASHEATMGAVAGLVERVTRMEMQAADRPARKRIGEAKPK